MSKNAKSEKSEKMGAKKVKNIFVRDPEIFSFFQKSKFLKVLRNSRLPCLCGKFYELLKFTQENSRKFWVFSCDFFGAKSEIHGKLGRF